MDEEPALGRDAHPARRHEWLLVLAVVCIAVVPDLFNALLVWPAQESVTPSFYHLQTALIVRAIQVAAAVLAIVALSGIDWKSIGVVPVRWLPDLLLGAGVWLAGNWAYYFVQMLLPAAVFAPVELGWQFTDRTNPLSYVLLVVASLANAFAEELVLRGYLLTRLERLLRSTWAAVLITSLLFASYHLYQGLGPTISIAALGLMYGAAYCRIRRLWPLVVAHAATDITYWLVA